MLAYNFETINHYFKLTGQSVAYSHDYDCEENNSESKKSDEKNEKKDFSEYLVFNKVHTALIIARLSFIHHSRSFYSSSDYSLVIYSPPDLRG